MHKFPTQWRIFYQSYLANHKSSIRTWWCHDLETFYALLALWWFIGHRLILPPWPNNAQLWCFPYMGKICLYQSPTKHEQCASFFIRCTIHTMLGHFSPSGRRHGIETLFALKDRNCETDESTCDRLLQQRTSNAKQAVEQTIDL